MNILYYHRTQGRGAEGVHIVSIVDSMRRNGHSVTLLSPPGVDPFSTAGNAPTDKSRVKTSGVHSFWRFLSMSAPQHVFELAELAYNIYALLQMFSRLLTGRYGMIYERYAFFSFAAAIAASVFRVPYGIEANEVSGVERARKQKNRRLMRMLERFAFMRASAIFTVSSYLRDRIVEMGIPAEKVFVVPNAIDPGLFEKPSGARVRAELGIAREEVVIGFAGWFDEWDRLDELIRVFSRISQARPCRLMLVGDGRMAASLKAQAEVLGEGCLVTFTGAVPRKRVVDYIDAFDIAVLPHSNEFGSPVVLFEFMALSKAIVAPSLRPITDVLTNGLDSLVFRPSDWSMLEECLSRLVEDAGLRKRLGRAAKERAMERHTWDANAAIIVDACIGGGRAAA